MLLDAELSVNITNNVKAGNIEEAKKLIETMDEYAKKVRASRIKKLIDRKKGHMSVADVKALTKVRELLQASTEANKDLSKLRKPIPRTTKERIAAGTYYSNEEE